MGFGFIALSVALGFGLIGVTIVTKKNDINILLMKFFRNLSRFKARRRLYGNQASLIPLLMGNEPEVLMIRNDSLVDEGDGFTMTLAELAEMDGKTESTPIYISIKGQIFDISEGREMYGPGKGYHPLVAKEAASAFAAGCFQDGCFKTPIDKLSPEQLIEVDRWIDLYRNHDKYKLVGRLVSDPVDQIIADDEKVAQLEGSPTESESPVAASDSDSDSELLEEPVLESHQSLDEPVEEGEHAAASDAEVSEDSVLESHPTPALEVSE